MNSSTEKIIYFMLGCIFVVIYFICFDLAKRGHGYVGSDRAFRSHSFWYVRNYDHSFYPSNRERSVNGNRFSSRGISGGK